MRRRLIVRLTTPILISSCLLLAVGALTVWYVQHMQRSNSDVLAVNIISMRAAEELEIGIREVRSQLDLFLLTGDAKHLARIPDLRRESDRWLGEAERTGTTRREKQLMARVKQGYAHFFAEFDRITREEPPRDKPQHIHELIDGVLTHEILAPAHEYLDFNEEQISQTMEQNQRIGQRLIWGLLLLGICGCGVGLMAGYAVARGVSRSIIQLSLPIRDATGRLGEVIGPVTFTDPQELHDLEGALQKMSGQITVVIDRLRQREREVLRAEQLAKVGQLAAGIAHELRNPLMSMKLLVQAAAENSAACLEGQDLVILEEEIIRLERATQTFLDFARPPQLLKQSFDPRSLLTQTVALVSGRAGQQDVRIECDLPKAPSPLTADQGQVRQVLLNLLINALDALPQGGVVRLRLTRDGQGNSTFRVEDDGPGLPAELGPRIFEPFISTKTTGLGLGLSICRRIAEAHGGELTAVDRPGGGAIFTFRLPSPAGPAVESRRSRCAA
ncbi:MAG: histidine kinase [Gemmataceae bacterium]|nr:histidine kinase [Gemmataceae bacterium]